MSFQKIVFVIAFLGIFAGGFFANAQPAQAATVEELQALIAQLKAQIVQLQQQLAQSQGQPAAWCHDFNTNIRLGDSGDEVYALQFALLKEGLLSEGDETSSEEFGENTASAVVGFQQKYKDEVLRPFGLKFGTGFVGKGTRAKLNALYGCGVAQPPAKPPISTLPIPPIQFPIPTPTPQPTSPSITVLSPKGGEQWAIGTSQAITWRWSASSFIKQVSISLASATSSPRWSSIAPPLAASGFYAWTVNTQGGEIGPYILQICGYLTIGAALDEPSVCAQSQTFSIVDKVSVQPSITVVSPNGGEKWELDKEYAITWKHNLAGNFEAWIDLLKGGAYFGAIAGDAVRISNAQNVTSYSWRVGDMKGGVGKGDDYQVRITYNDGNTGKMLTDTSDNYFSIVSATTASQPPTTPVITGSTSVNAGQSVSYSFVSTVKSFSSLDLDFFITWGDETGDQTGGAGEDCIVKSTVKASLDGTQTFVCNATHVYRQTGVYTIKAMAVSNLSIADWSAKGTLSVKVSTTTPSITVLSPNGGENWMFGNPYTITWKSSAVQTAYVYLQFPDGVMCKLTQVYAASGYFGFTPQKDMQCPGISRTLTAGQYKVAIYGESETVKDFSDNYFSIVSAVTIQPSLTVLSPIRGELSQGVSYPITWQAGDFSRISIYLDKADPTLASIVIADNILNTGSYTWMIKDTAPGSYKIRICEYRDPTAAFYAVACSPNNNYFSIVSATTTQPFITVLFPNGGETWMLGKTYTISWKSTSGTGLVNADKLEKVRILLVRPNGLSSIIADYVSTYSNTVNSYSWDPNSFASTFEGFKPGEGYKIKIVNYFSAPNIADTSDASFSIVSTTTATPSITVVSPNGVESFTIGQTYDITWKFSGQADKLIQLELGLPASDGSLIATRILAASQRYSWTVPSTTAPRTDYRIIIREPSPSYMLLDSSDSYFSIVSGTQIKATDSDNSPDYTFGVASYPVTPQKYPDLFVAGVGKGDYVGGGPCIYGTEPSPMYCKPTSDNLTTHYDYCVGSTQLNEGFVNSSGRLGVVGVLPPSGYECRNGAFIPIQQPSITVLSPNGGEQWVKGNTYDITWKATGVEQVTIDISTDGIVPSKAYTLQSGIPASPGRYSWKMDSQWPDLSPGNYKIRIFTYPLPPSSGWIEGSNYDVSDNYFSIVSATATPSITADLKVNNSDYPSAVAYDSLVTVSWTSTAAVSCAGYGAYIPLVGGGLWTDLANLPTSGSKTLYARHNTFGYQSSLQIGIQCFDALGNAKTDSISLPVTLSTSAPVGLQDVQDQLASVSSAVVRLLEQIKALPR